jgi:hypothetical protein
MAELVFYRYKKGRIRDWLIAWVTWGKYSHAEVKLTDGPGAAGPCITGSFVDGGVRWKHIDLKSGRWQRYKINPEVVLYVDELTAAEWVECRKGQRYDMLGMLLVPFTWWSKKLFRRNRWFCSELSAALCRQMGLDCFPTTQISPNRMERICRRHPEIFTPLPDDATMGPLSDEKQASQAEGPRMNKLPGPTRHLRK